MYEYVRPFFRRFMVARETWIAGSGVWITVGLPDGGERGVQNLRM